MTEFEFSIIASGLDPAAADFESRFFDAGCDDATVSFQKGHIIVDFAREAETFQSAIVSAVQDVLRTGASIDRIEPDPLVSLKDIAERTGMTRAAITQYAKGQRREGFPAPRFRVTSASPMWLWSDVSNWLYSADQVKHETVIEAQILEQANAVIDAAGTGDFERELGARIQAVYAAA